MDYDTRLNYRPSQVVIIPRNNLFLLLLWPKFWNGYVVLQGVIIYLLIHGLIIKALVVLHKNIEHAASAKNGRVDSHYYLTCGSYNKSYGRIVNIFLFLIKCWVFLSMESSLLVSTLSPQIKMTFQHESRFSQAPIRISDTEWKRKNLTLCSISIKLHELFWWVRFQ